MTSLNRTCVVWALGLLMSACATTPDPYDNKRPNYLTPYGVSADAPALVRYVVPDSPAKGVVQIGDRVISIDDSVVPNTYSFYQMVFAGAQSLRVQSVDGVEKDIPAINFVDPNSYKSWAWLFEPGQTITFKLNNPTYADDRDAGLVLPRNIIGLVTASIWPTNPRYLEVYVDLRVNPECTDCQLENVAVLDLSRNSWLTPVSPDYVAWALYPAAGQAPNFVAVPPPTPIGYTGTTSSTGTFNAHNYGNYVSGTYSGTGVTNITPYYDYTATNMAMAYNLGAMIRQSQIQAHGTARNSFVSRRQSNFRLGVLNPGERITGFVHYQLPAGFDGPYLVAIKAGTLGIARFDVAK